MNLLSEYEAGKNIEAKIVSFDVFDTVVTRITADPAGIFFKLQQKLAFLPIELPVQLLERFAYVRVNAERTARRKKTREEISFYDIYREIGCQYGLKSEVVERLMELEIDMELESIRSIPVNLRRIQDLRKEGKKIIFISDMYLPMLVIRKLLEKAQVFDPDDEIYVSSEFGLTKSSGNLYLGVLAREGCPPHQLLHIGDNRRSDYLMARKVGKISAYHFAEGYFTRFENILRVPFGSGSELTWQLIAGASRVARLQSHEQVDVHRKALHSIGANVAGPILWGFVGWVLEQAIERKIRRLYFVARDGQILYDIALRLCAATGSDLELVYLYGSRQAWHLPALTRITATELQWITVKDPFLTLRLVASRLCLEPETLASHLRMAGFTADDLDQDLTSRQIDKLNDLLLHSADLQALILSKVDTKLNSVASYLRQEGLFDNISWALVDSGWNGRLQNSLSCILKKNGWNGKVFGFYLGLLSSIYPPESKEGYLFSPSAPFSRRKWGSSMLYILELMMSADHGITRSYEMNESCNWLPVLSGSNQNLFDKLGLSALREGVSAFLEHLDLTSINLDHDQFRKKAMQLLSEFYLAPPREAAIALGQLPYATDQTEKNFLPFAPALSFRDACHFAVKMTPRDRSRLTFWVHGSRVQSSPIVNAVLYVAGMLHRLARSLHEAFRGFRMLARSPR